ncbi:MAG: hypothetical protein K2Q18_17465, partial [Bdellovibrionales bacterium]|nr:hypothetical protein [Bdellovibrionales bacterium]
MKALTSLLLVFLFILGSCSQIPNSETIFVERELSSGPSRINGKENVTPGVAKLLNEEQNLHNKDLWGAGAFKSNIDPKYVPEENPKFPLPYYLIPEEDSNFLLAKSLNTDVSKQLKATIDGKKYFKLFVHPESEEHYRFLRGKVPYISAKETEFTASPTSSYRSLVVWNNNDINKKPFIAKVSLDKNVIGSIDRLVSFNEVERSIANQKAFDSIGKKPLENIHVKIYPESAGLTLKEGYEGAPAKLGGQLIREIPDEVINSQKKWFSFSALMSPNRKPHPLIMDVIQASGLSSYDFFKKFMIESYMDMFEELSLKRGINFEPHSQNLSFETGMDLVPTNQWVIRDFGGVWPDVLTMAKNGGPVELYMESANATKFKLRGGRANYISSYVFFYKRQVFDMMLAEVAKFDKKMTPARIIELNDQIDALFVKKINNYLGIKVKNVPTMATYKTIEKLVLDNTTLDDGIKKTEVKENQFLK